MRHAYVCFVILMAVSLSLTLAYASIEYTVTNLGTLGGGDASAEAINTAGEVVGQSNTSRDIYHAFLWRGGQMTDLGTSGARISCAVGLNDMGSACGWLDFGNGGPHHAFYFDGLGHDLGTFGGSESWAFALNNGGQLVGSYILQKASRAFLWQNGQMLDLGAGCAWGINDMGEIVGEAGQHFCGATVLAKNLGVLPGDTRSAAYDLNDRGQVVGCSMLGSGAARAFIWQDGIMRQLPSPPGYTRRYAFGINRRGDAVGSAISATGGVYPVLWRDGRVFELARLVPGVGGGFANDINDAGQIACTCNRALLLTPVAAPPITVAIDIRPGSYPNSINLRANGVVPVGVLTTQDFDASSVEPSTIRFAAAAPKNWSLEDLDADGNPDLILHFLTNELCLTTSSTSATLYGMTESGEAIEGSDNIRIAAPR